MKKELVFLMLGCMVMLSACSGVKSRVKGGEIGRTMDEEGITDNYIQSVGIGAADEKCTGRKVRCSDYRRC